MVNPILIVTACIFAVLVMVTALYFLIYYQHPDDKLVAWFPKIVVVLGLSLACYNILLLPLDVANQAKEFVQADKIPLKDVEQGFFLVTIALVLIVVPFSIFYYEGQDDSDVMDEKKGGSQIMYALKWMFPTILILGVIIGVMYVYIGFANVTTVDITAPLIQVDPLQTQILFNQSFYNYTTFCPTPTSCVMGVNTVPVKVSIMIYMIALVSFAGWLVFIVFAGVGLVTLPMDFLVAFKYRPRNISTAQYEEGKKIIGEAATRLMKVRDELKAQKLELRKSGTSGFTRKDRQYTNRENNFKKDVYLLDIEYRRLEEARNQSGNPVLIYAGLAAGLLFTIISIMWVVHTIIYTLPVIFGQGYLDGLLNNMFKALDTVPFLGTFFYGLFAFSMLLYVMKGNARFGLRIACITIHPLLIGETLMSSLLFNTGLILFSSLAVLHFNVLSFQDYAVYTATFDVFGVQLQYLIGIGYVYPFFIPVMLGVAVITLLYLVIRKSPLKKKRAQGRRAVRLGGLKTVTV